VKGSHSRVLLDIVGKHSAQDDKGPEEPVGRRDRVILEEGGPPVIVVDEQRTQKFWADSRQTFPYQIMEELPVIRTECDDGKPAILLEPDSSPKLRNQIEETARG